MNHLITREIGIDMGHRVTYHGSKCRNLHGHRYTVQATCSGPLFTDGEQEGMVLDFGFLKDEMMLVIDEFHDHGMTLWGKDPLLNLFLDDEQVALAQRVADEKGFYYTDDSKSGKLMVVPFVPTAENLAHFWFKRMAPGVGQRTGNQATLFKVKVWETPNCSAEYPG